MSQATCRRCGEQVPSEAEFCAKPDCPEYVAWDRPPEQVPVGEPPHGEEEPARGEQGRPPDEQEPSPGASGLMAVVHLPEEVAEEKKLSVEAGKEVAFKALIRNQSDIVDRYTLSVRDLDETWWTIEPGYVNLLPFKTGEQYEQTVEVRLHPPRSSKATARLWEIAVTAESHIHRGQTANAETAVEIQPFDAARLEAIPEQAAGRGIAHLRLVVTNESNHKLDVEVSGRAKDEGCRLRFPSSTVSIDAGQKVHGQLEMRATKSMLAGRPVDHKLILWAIPAKAHSAGADDKKDLKHMDAVFRQHPWLPWWTSLVALAALALAALLVAKNLERVPVPKVSGQEISMARHDLEAHRLEGFEKVAAAPNDNTAAGDVFAEIPAAGTMVSRDSKVTLLTAAAPGSRLVKVPELEDLPMHVAENRLSKAGFAIGEVKPSHPQENWVVVTQEPSAGMLVQRDKTKVDVRLDEVAVVPELTGQDPAKALQMLRSLGLILVSPTALSPAEVIATQKPAANVVVRVGEEVEVTLAAPKPKPAAARPAKAPKAKPKAKSTAAAALPALGAASSAPAAAAALAKAGLRTLQTFAISPTVPAGRLLRTEPAAGTKLRRGASVTLIVSAGFPQVAVDDGRRVLALNGVTGKAMAVIAGGPTPAVEPSWSPDGREVAYVSGGRVMLIATHGAAGPRALTRAGERFAAPTFPSSSSAPAVLVTISDLPSGVQAVCLLAVTHSTPSCIPEPGWTLGESISWSPTGTELLVAASRAVSSPGEVGLLRFTTRRPFSVRARDWRPSGPAVGLATPVVNGAGVLAGAFSPDDSGLALVEDLAGFNSVALVAPSDLTLTKAKKLAQLTSVCAVQWRADGAELLVQVGEGKGAGEGQCASSTGALYRVNPAQPGALSFLARGVSHPSWQPLAGVG